VAAAETRPETTSLKGQVFNPGARFRRHSDQNPSAVSPGTGETCVGHPPDTYSETGWTDP
jgi:hypothetical protein